MAPFSELPADQKAVLQLVLRQGRTYDEIGGLLRISPEAVRERALTALGAIGPAEMTDLDGDRQDEIGDYLLGQQSASQRAATRALLQDSAPARSWARQVAGELRSAGVGGDQALPDIAADPEEVDEAFGALEARHRARAEHERSSRWGGALLLVGLGLIVAVAILLLTGTLGGGDKGDSGSVASTPTAADTTTTSTTTGASVEAQINLNPPAGSSSAALGVANVVSQDGKRALAVVGQKLAASGHYVLWLRNGTKVKFLGFFPPVTGSGSSKGRLQGLVAAPSDLASYTEILVSREPGSKPTRPTAVVLTGKLTG
ncbi:sigma factor-like helix-turn-helix DNA-binding protein [Baekduia soli]|nr:sigma factor-like helix-turn-helix DNA-binding protein [Baekduia soli]